MSISTPQRHPSRSTDPPVRRSSGTRLDPPERWFPGWRWVAVALVGGGIVFTLLSGLLLAHFTPAPEVTR